MNRWIEKLHAQDAVSYSSQEVKGTHNLSVIPALFISHVHSCQTWLIYFITHLGK